MGLPHSRSTQEGRGRRKSKNPGLPRFLEAEHGHQKGLLSVTFHGYNSGPRIRIRELQLLGRILQVQSCLHVEGGPTENNVHHRLGHIRLQPDALRLVQCSKVTFFFDEIMMRFGHLLELVSNRGKHFLNDVVFNITSWYSIKHRKTTPYNPKANGLTEHANGIAGKILKKMMSAHKMDWNRKLPSAVHAYNTYEKQTTCKSPFFLVFGQGAVHGVELEVEILRVMAYREGIRMEDLGFRMMAIQHLEET